ncbi:subtilisin-like protein [Lactarius hengduanensis]|nr:subtilisin-like protein [Lactarius hengduanensis]
MCRILISVLFVLSIATPIAALWDNMRVKHAWTAISANWECLAQPGGPEQVAELIALSLDTLELVNCWLKHHGVSPSSISRTHGGGWLMVSGVPVSRANEMLGASYQLYWHAGTNVNFPHVLYVHVQTIAPTTHFASMGTLQQTPPTRFDGAAASLGEGASGEPKDVSRRDVRVTPMFLRVLYGTVKYEPAAATGRNVLGVTGYLGQYPSPSDPVEQVNGGGDNPNDPGDEANLNIQVTQGMTYPVQHVFYSSAGPPPFNSDGSWSTNSNEPYLDWIIYITSKGPIPLTITTSYGDDEQTVPEDYAKSVCTLFARFGQRGVSVLFASGDSGVGRGDYMANDDSGKDRFLPIFPISCPWVTSFGGTRSYRPETGASFSGGGFSNYFPREEYHPWGRGILDISHNRPTTRSSFAGVLSAHASFPSLPSSLSRPSSGILLTARSQTAVGVISLLDDYQIAHGKDALGFLNPWLYGGGLASTISRRMARTRAARLMDSLP